MFDEPVLTPVTCGCVSGVVVFCGTKTLGVTVTDGLLLMSVMVTPPAGAGAERLSVTFCVAPNGIDRVPAKLIPAPTCTGLLSPIKPGADALMFAVPKAIPVTCGCAAGVDAWNGMKTVVGVMVT